MLVFVDRPEYDDSLVVVVEGAENKMHARLAAYYHIYGVQGGEPTRERLIELTGFHNSGGIANAKFYKNPFKE